MKLSNNEISELREKFSDREESLNVLDLIEECEGDLIESASLLALEAGVSLTRKDPDILNELAQKCRKVVCDDAFDDLMAGFLGTVVGTLAASGQIPEALATPVVIYLCRIGVKNFCGSNNG